MYASIIVVSVLTATTGATTTVAENEPDSYTWAGWHIGLLIAGSIIVVFLILLLIVTVSGFPVSEVLLGLS